MTYSLSSIARNVGSVERNWPNASRRAFCTAACSVAGRIGKIAETVSSEAISSAITRSIFSPRRLGMVESKADIDTRQRTNLASGAGRSGGSGWVVGDADTRTIRRTADEQTLTERPFDASNPNGCWFVAAIAEAA